MRTHSRKSVRIGLALAMTAAAIVGTASSSSAAVAKATVSPSSGSNAVNTVVTLTAASGTFATTGGTAKIKVTTDGVQFNAATACPTVPAAEGATIKNASEITLVNGTKVVLKLPALTAGTYQVCVYNTDTTAVVAAGKYIAAAPPTVTAITPSAGPVYGGSSVTVDGTNFTSKSTATVGGVALTGIKVATDGLSLTGVVPANSSGAKDVVVTATGGNGTLAGGFTYMDGVSVSPKTQAAAAKQVVEVTGYGFTSLNFATTAKVYLVVGNYDPTDDGGGAKTNPEVATCGSVITVSNSELVCTLDGTGTPLPVGAYTVVVVSDGAVGAQAGGTYRETIVASPATYTVAPY